LGGAVEVRAMEYWESRIGEHGGKSHWIWGGRINGRIDDGARFTEGWRTGEIV